MITSLSEYRVYLYRPRVDLRKDINGLCGIVRSEMGLDPMAPKCIYIFGGTSGRVRKVLVRERNRFELVKVRLDAGRFFRPEVREDAPWGTIRWEDLVILTGSSAQESISIEFDAPSCGADAVESIEIL